MRKITKQAVEAFENNKNFKSGNMEVKCIPGLFDQMYMYLHGNLIAKKVMISNDPLEDKIEVTLAGWNTPTTRERLNGITGVSVYTRRGQAYLNGNPIDDNKFYTI